MPAPTDPRPDPIDARVIHAVGRTIGADGMQYDVLFSDEYGRTFIALGCDYLGHSLDGHTFDAASKTVAIALRFHPRTLLTVRADSDVTA